jgi:hypothetical protein
MEYPSGRDLRQDLVAISRIVNPVLQTVFLVVSKIAPDITVTVRYKELNLNQLEHEWDVNPRLYEGVRTVDYSGMTDLVDVIDRKPDDAIGGAPR